MKTPEKHILIPMSEITDEARKIAVAWMDCEDKNWIGQKHKLASDIMNYAKNQATPLQAIIEKQGELINRFLKGNLEIPIRDYSVYQKLKDELFLLQKGKEEKIMTKKEAQEYYSDLCFCEDSAYTKGVCDKCGKLED